MTRRAVYRVTLRYRLVLLEAADSRDEAIAKARDEAARMSAGDFAYCVRSDDDDDAVPADMRIEDWEEDLE